MFFRVMCARVAAQSGVKVYLQKCPADTEDTSKSDLVSNDKWQNLPGKFHEMPLDKFEGKTLCSKIEAMMACAVGY